MDLFNGLMHQQAKEDHGEREGVKSYSRKNWYCRGQVS